VHTSGRDIAVTMPSPATSPDGVVMSIDMVARGLAQLPPESLARVTEVRVSDHTNSVDPGWRVAYHWPPEVRSFMTCGARGVIDIYLSSPAQPLTQESVDGSMIHETGHAVSNGLWGDLPQPPRAVEPGPETGWGRWSTAMREDGFVPSGYARSDLPEDFAESLRYFMLVRGTPEEAEMRARYPHRCGILDSVLAAHH